MILDFIHNELGLGPEEAIPALAVAMVISALSTENPHQALDEAVNLLEFEIDSE